MPGRRKEFGCEYPVVLINYRSNMQVFVGVYATNDSDERL